MREMLKEKGEEGGTALIALIAVFEPSHINAL